MKLSPAKPEINISLTLLALICVSSLMQGIDLPILNVAPFNLLTLLFSMVIILLNFRFIGDVWEKHRNLILSATALYLWTFVPTLTSVDRDAIIKYPIKYSQYYLLFIAMLFLAQNNGVLPRALKLFYGFMAGLAIFALFEIIFYNEITPFMAIFRPEQSLRVLPRISSLMIWPNQFGVLQSLFIVLGLIMWNRGVLSGKTLLFSAPVMVLAVSLSGSRNAWLTLALGLGTAFVMGVLRLKPAIALAGFWTLAMFSFPIPTNQLGIRDSNIVPLSQHFKHLDRNLGGLPDPSKVGELRKARWGKGIDAWLDNPILGIGLGVYPAFWSYYRGEDIRDLPDPSMATQLRKERWGKGIEVWLENPVLGIGLGGFSARWSDYRGTEFQFIDNLFLFILVDLGLAGLLLATGFMVFLVKKMDLKQPLVLIPLILFFTSQIIDCFLHDAIFMIVYSFLFAFAAEGSAGQPEMPGSSHSSSHVEST